MGRRGLDCGMSFASPEVIEEEQSGWKEDFAAESE